MSKSRLFHNIGAAYINDRARNELAQTLLIGGTCTKHGSYDVHFRTVVLLSFALIKSLSTQGQQLTVFTLVVPVHKTEVEYATSLQG